MTSRHVVLELALLVATAVTSCSSSSATPSVDAVAPVDLDVADDLSPDLRNPTRDVFLGDVLDATTDRSTTDRGTDAAVDVGVDARGPIGDAWAGVPLVDLGGFLIPVDPNAVPAPGSECTGDAGVRAGDPAIVPPQPVRPLSVSRVSSQRPTFQWVLPEGTTGARVEVCADRCCTRVLQTLDAEGTTVRPMTALPPGVVFWRMFGRRGTTAGSRASYTWEFEVGRRDAPNDTSGGTIRDFNGDGFDDLVAFRSLLASGASPDLLLLAGSAEGLRAPVVTGVVARALPYRAMVGDFNGDGLADIAWDDHHDSGLENHSWFEVVSGSRGPMRSARQPDMSTLGSCAVTGDGAVVDWNGDGYSDLITGVRLGCGFNVDPEASILLGYSGSPTGIASTPQWALRVDRLFPYPLVNVRGGPGDLDNDGYGDISIMSLRLRNGGGPAEHAILHGVGMGEPRIERWLEPATGTRSWSDGRVASVGDVDGDGYLDLLMSLNYASPVYIYRHSTGLARPSSHLLDPLGGRSFGFRYSSGDVNGDGLWDVIVSSVTASDLEQDGLPANAGRVYVFLGSAGGVLAEPVTLSRARPGMEVIIRQSFGSYPVSPGDINGDGIDDVTMTDSLGSRLCVRHGRLGFASGSPDVCLEGFDLSGALTY